MINITKKEKENPVESSIALLDAAEYCQHAVQAIDEATTNNYHRKILSN